MNKINYNEKDLINHKAVAAIIKNKKGQILMQNHVKYGFWTIPIGKVESNQSIQEGLSQELLEECDIIVKDIKLISTKEHNYIRNNKKVKVENQIFHILNYKGTIKNKEPHKHKEQKFIDMEDIKKLPYLSDATIMYLESLGIKRESKIN